MVFLCFALWLVEELTTWSQPTRNKTESNHHLVMHIFPRFKYFALFHFKILLATCDNSSCSDGMLQKTKISIIRHSIKWKGDERKENDHQIREAPDYQTILLVINIGYLKRTVRRRRILRWGCRRSNFSLQYHHWITH